MNPGAARLVVQPKKPRVQEMTAVTPIQALAKCIPLPAVNAIPKLRSLFSPAVIDRYFAGIVTPNLNNHLK
jgi:hypothetical protein